ncbi:MAG: hypothetical protein IKX48_08440 [Victivallales bacterium]|nr:hypothetical protein [Victivallales bacterium]
MEHGEGSEEYTAWVLHCRHCSECRSELFILETLREDAEDEKVHLPREKVAQLAMMARARYGKRRNYRVLRMVWGFMWKTAALAAMVILLLNILPFERHHHMVESPRMAIHPYGSRTQMARRAETNFQALSANSDMNGLMSLSPGEASYEHRLELIEGGEFMDMTALLPSQAFDNRIREAGLRIARQRDVLNDLIDHDLTGY